MACFYGGSGAADGLNALNPDTSQQTVLDDTSTCLTAAESPQP